MNREEDIAIIEEWEGTGNAFKASGRWYPCAHSLRKSISDMFRIGDTVSIELHLDGRVKSVALRHRPASAEQK